MLNVRCDHGTSYVSKIYMKQSLDPCASASITPSYSDETEKEIKTKAEKIH